MQKVFYIEGMGCAGCSAKVTNALVKLGAKASVNHATGKAEVEYEAPITEADIKKTIESLGYDVVG